MPESDILLEPTVEIDTSNGDHDVFAHYADKNAVTEAMVNGTPVMALCGKVWIPSRDPSRYPVCPLCQDIYNQIFGL